MRLCPSVLLLANLALASSGTRWLQLCDKGPSAPPTGTVAWENAPLRTDLLDSLKGRGWTIHRIYKWENKVSAAPPSTGTATLPSCVTDVGAVAMGRPITPRKDSGTAARVAARTTSIDEYTTAMKVIWDSLGITKVHTYLDSLGISAGAGITIAFMDDVFQLGHKVLQGIDFKDSWDYIRDDSISWDTASSPWPSSDMHGTQTSGLVASRWDMLPGIAPYANFLLYHTENDAVEDSTEEGNLAQALVRADSLGAKVASISLGYRYVTGNDDSAMHPWSSYDGKTLVDSRAATAAARRGMVVVAASGNEANVVGGKSIGSPADADSILVVGAVNSSDQRCFFSSFGPTYDGRRKPEVSAYGCDVPIAATTNAAARMYGAGTSYAAPLVAGMAVLVRQLLPGLTAIQVVEAFKASGTRAGNPDDSVGWGVPSLLRISELKGQISSSVPVARLVWHRPYAGSPWVLSFGASSIFSGSRLGLDLRDLQGRVLFRWEGIWQTGMKWTPFSKPRPGIVVARWWGDYGDGAANFLVVP